jgi:hypothetical protein
MSQNFEPYIDWASVSPEMAKDMHEKMLEYRAAIKAFEASGSTKDCSDVMRCQFELTNISAVIQQQLFVLPVMVHIAGEKIHEPSLHGDEDEEPHEHIIQRCTRCGSILQMWCEVVRLLTPEGPVQVPEEGISWWEPGAVIAKASDDDSMTMYVIEDGRELEKHEHECLDLTGLEGHKLDEN